MHMLVSSKYSSSSVSLSNPPQHAESSRTTSSREGTVDEVFNLVSRESIVAMGMGDKMVCPLTPNKSWSSLGTFSEESTASITECSSRSSLQDLELSFEEFRDPLPSPQLGYWKRLGERDHPRKNRHPFLPSVLTRSPRAVSFSGVAEVHVYGEGSEGEGLQRPMTPAIEWYSSKGMSQNPRHHQAAQSIPVLSTRKPLIAPRLQPRRSALKSTRHSTSPLQAPGLEYPSSPKVTYYSSKT